MNCTATTIPYRDTGFFANIILDYLTAKNSLQQFYEHAPDAAHIKSAIEQRQEFSTNRDVLVNVLQKQYASLTITPQVAQNIQLLQSPHTYTITTAHQPNIFTGPLYFIYKILHAVKLAAHCKDLYPQYNFVPVYYMGSEDADIDELGHIYMSGEKLTWNTNQTGAVGRMQVDEPLLQMIKKIEGEINVLPYGKDITGLVKEFYTNGNTIQQATAGFVNALFGKYGLIIIIPDDADLKSLSIDLFKDELLQSQSSGIVAKTAQMLEQSGYKAQAQGRDINLFYLTNGRRSRIERVEDAWKIIDTDIVFTQQELLQELQHYPEKFSPNVILRGLFQETILPNIAFIGGGGELAYWLQLKDLFQHCKVPYPMLVLRNSFLIIENKIAEKLTRLGFSEKDIFQSLKKLQDDWVHEHSTNNMSVDASLDKLKTIYKELQFNAADIDVTLGNHIQALQKNAEDKINALGKKMLRAEKRNYSDAMRQIAYVKEKLFPANNLQERIENIIPFYATYGPQLLDMLLNNSQKLDQEFVVLQIDQSNSLL